MEIKIFAGIPLVIEAIPENNLEKVQYYWKIFARDPLVIEAIPENNLEKVQFYSLNGN